MENDWKKRLGTVYSTNPDYEYNAENEQTAKGTLPPEKQKLKVRIDKKMRKGKTVTLVEGFEGTETDLKDLEKLLKFKLGTGGTAKDGVIIIQGDFSDRIVQLLSGLNYKVKKI